MWFILSLVIGAALFGGRTHEFSSVRHFATEAECVAYLPTDRDELEAELIPRGLAMPYLIKGRCEQDGVPA